VSRRRGVESAARGAHEPTLWLPAGLAVVASLVMTWPIAIHLGGRIPTDTFDPLFDSWQVAWIGHALLHQPLHLFQGNRFYPLHDSLAFNDVMLGYAPAGFIAEQGLQAALVVHNLLVVFAYGLAFFGAYLLALELGAGAAASLVAGAAYAFAPWRIPETGHLQVISSGGIPLALFLLVRGYRRRRPGLVLGGWLVTAWQLTLGFTYGIPMSYCFGAIGVVAAVAWWLDGARRLPRPVVVATAGGICVFALVAVLQVRPYLRVLHDHPEAKRTKAEVAFFSPPPRAFLSAPAESFVWGDATAGTRRTLRFQVEQDLFPGVAVLALALLGLFSRAYPPGIRLGLVVGVVAWGVLSLGLPHYPDAERGFTPYRLMYDIAPGWNGMRTPGRLNTFTSLGLALLAAGGLSLLVRGAGRVRSLRLPSQRAFAGTAVAVCLTGVVMLEGFGPLPHPRVPRPPAGEAGAQPPLLHLPTDELYDQWYSWWSVGGFPKMANGGGSFIPTQHAEMRQIVQSFPDRSSVAYLRGIGIRTVILHPELAYGPWAAVASRPIAGLGITREAKDGVILFHLRP
jgi:hypothetical protein